MTDLSRILPDFPIGQYARLIPAIERQQLTTADLLTLEVADIGKRTQLPLLDVKRFCGAVLEALHVDLGVSDKQKQQQQRQHQHQQQQKQQPRPNGNDDDEDDEASKARRNKSEGNGTGTGNENERRKNKNAPLPPPSPSPSPSHLRHTLPELAARWRTISTLDPALDRALGGGVPTGRVTEVTGESGAGKTQLLLTLLLAVQLPPALGGLGRPALYVSTEAPLSTVRLSQILRNHPRLRGLGGDGDGDGDGSDEKKRGGAEERERQKPPSLDHIISTVVPDLESQDHILSFQVPVEVARRGVGLVVLDSVAANYRAEFERSSRGGGGASGLAARSNELVRLGRLLHDLARQHDLAVVVSNQVADRFPSSSLSMAAAAAMATATPAAVPKSSLPASTVTHRHHHHPAYMGGGGGGRGRGSVKQSQESPLASRSRGGGGGGGGPSAIIALLDAEPTSSVPVPVSSTEPEPEPELEDEDEEARMAAAVAVRSSMPEPAAPPEGRWRRGGYQHQHQHHDQPSSSSPAAPAALLLDHQQRWFTGWGDDARYHYSYDGGEGEGEAAQSLKTPSLGLVWSTQIAARIALLKRPAYYRRMEEEDEEEDEEEGAVAAAAGLKKKNNKTWRRWFKVVFAPHVAPSGSSLRSRDGGGGCGDGPVEFEITMGGLRAVEKKGKGKGKDKGR